MTQAEAKRAGCAVVARLIESYFNVGQPFEDAAEYVTSEQDAERIYRGMVEIHDEMDWRSLSPSLKRAGGVK